MFLGEYRHSVDDKGRIKMPSKFRDGLAGSFIVTKGLDRCLFVYESSEWEKINEKVKSLPVTDANIRRFVRFFFGGACEVEPDGQDRSLIPQNLREYAGITKDIVTVGVSNRIEIWSKDNWDDYSGDMNYVDEQLAEKMAEFGI